MHRWIGVIAIAVGLVPAAVAGAQDVDPQRDEQARLHFEVGAEYFESGEYRDAIREFQRAYELSGRERMHYNLSGCYERLGEFEEAAEHLSAYLDRVEDVANRDALTRRLENLRERAAEQAARQAEPVQPEPQAAPVPQAVPEPEPDPAPAPVASGGPDGGLLAGAVSALVLGGLGFGAQAAFGVLALEEDAALAEGCGASVSCREDELGTMQTMATLSDVGLGVGIAGVAVGAVLLGVAFASAADEDVAVTVFGDPTGAGAAIRGSY